jgi:hypothetical protein
MPTAHSHFDTVELSKFESLIDYLPKAAFDNLEVLAALPQEFRHIPGDQHPHGAKCEQTHDQQKQYANHPFPF